MIDRRITIPFIFIIAAAVILAVSISDPFDIATANSGVKMIENKAEVLQESNVQAITENTLEIEESGEVFEETKDIVKLRAILIKKINATLLHPGWVKIQIDKKDFTSEVDSIEIPKEDVYVPINKIEDYWVLIDENFEFAAFYNEIRLADGSEYLTYLMSDGSKWKAIDSEYLRKMDIPHLLDIQFLDKIISMGNYDDASIEYVTENGRKLVVINYVMCFPEPVGFGQLESQNVVEYSKSSYYDMDTGLNTKVEGWITFVDGTKMQSDLIEVSVSKYSELPIEIIEKINTLGE